MISPFDHSITPLILEVVGFFIGVALVVAPLIVLFL